MDPKAKEDEKSYNRSKLKWTDFKLNPDIISQLISLNMFKPTRVQEQVLQVACNPDRKKFNMLIRSANGSGKTMAFLVPILNSLEPGLKTAEDKSFKGQLKVNEIFKPQGVILTQNNVLQEQIYNILDQFRKYGEKTKSEKLTFKIGKLNKEEHIYGDIIICQVKSFLTRQKRGNMNLEQCKFVAIDEVDEIFDSDKESLSDALRIFEKSRPNVLTCSATMKEEFLKFYKDAAPGSITTNVNEIISKELGQSISLEGVRNYCVEIQSQKEMHNYVLSTIFKALYAKGDIKPQVFIFFNSNEQIYHFSELFNSMASDSISKESEYLKDLNVDKVAANFFVPDGAKKPVTIAEKRDIMTKFRNNETKVLLATNIVARGIDIRNVCFVINMGVPLQSDRDKKIDLDLYLHRVGRTGRNKDTGIALTLASSEEIKFLRDGILKIHKIKIEEAPKPEQIAQDVYDCMKKNAI